jgi:uncharacterized protein (TIGR02117 family)
MFRSFKVFPKYFIFPIVSVLVFIQISIGDILKEPDSVKIFIVSHGWHTGIVLPVTSIRNHSLHSLIQSDSIRYFEIGWGEYDFYRSPDPGAYDYIKASLWPTASALHIVQIDENIETYFPYSDIIHLNISAARFDSVCNFIDASLLKTEDGHLVDGGMGIYGNSRFYMGREKYYFPKTCNVWTARVLVIAGFDLTPLWYQRATPLMNRMSKYGTLIQKRLK